VILIVGTLIETSRQTPEYLRSMHRLNNFELLEKDILKKGVSAKHGFAETPPFLAWELEKC